MKKSILIIAALLMSAMAFSQSYGEIHGKILDQNGQPVEFATVYAEQGSKVTHSSTGIDGRFKIKPLNGGSYTIKASCVSYQGLEVLNVIVKGDDITFLNKLVMNSSVTIIGAEKKPTITHYVIPLIDVNETSKISADMDDYKNNPMAKNIQGIVSSLAPGVTAVGDGSQLSFKGSRTGTNLYYIDGVKIMGDRIPRIPSSGLKTISVYTGGVPAKYGDCTGGVVVIETKDYFSEHNKRKYAKK